MLAFFGNIADGKSLPKMCFGSFGKKACTSQYKIWLKTFIYMLYLFTIVIIGIIKNLADQ